MICRIFGRPLVLVLLLTIGAAPALAQSSAKGFEQARQRMVDEEVIAAGIKNPRVIQSMRDTPRHEFVPLRDPSTGANQRQNAYFDMSLPLGHGQTISPPVIVAYMTEQLDPQPTDRVLEIGTGSGYQAAVLSPLVKDVYTIEIVEQLGKTAAQTLKSLKYTNIHTKIGDGYLGWPDAAPFDKIIVTCSPEKVPQKLIDQLKDGGRMIVPVGERYEQVLYLFKKKDGKLESEALRPTLFVPMTGEAEEGEGSEARPVASASGQRRLRGADRQERGADRLVLLPADESCEGRRRPGREAVCDVLEQHAGAQLPGDARLRHRRAEGA